jgi:hypothetical protein
MTTMLAPTDKVSVVAQAVRAILVEASVRLGLQDVYYGDQEKIARSPSVAVETGNKNRDLTGAPRRTTITLQVFLILYHSKVQDNQVTRLECDLMAETIEDELHKAEHVTLGGLVSHSMVTNVEYGYARRANTLWTATRMTYETLSLVNLPMAATYPG